MRHCEVVGGGEGGIGPPLVFMLRPLSSVLALSENVPPLPPPAAEVLGSRRGRWVRPGGPVAEEEGGCGT